MKKVLARRAIARGITLFLVLAATHAAARGQLQAGPTLLEISAGAGATRLTLHNTGDSPVAAQVRIYAWSQPEGEDRLSAADDLAVSPPILEVAPGETQVVRLVRTGSPPTGKDASYRVVVDELPSPGDSGTTQVFLRMRYVIPLFIRAQDAPAATLACGLETAARQLFCENRGGRAAQLGASRLFNEHGAVEVLSEGLFGYVLPMSRRVWELPSDAARLAGSAVRLETRLDGQITTFDLDRSP